MEKQFNELYNAREEALRAWDATAYNRIQSEIDALKSYVAAEVRLGLREFEIVSISLN